ncbi:MAG: phosphonate C-P lyase system protein PhnG [Alphaproteobacteria bacterium]|nr:phosphonate C-P lyase system protein PhnG [Alphaproteobacteria bacterium]MBU1278363.1 phosphonate C-P lyase system protein PhnG [Alphaproteobacteria bacterium]MBU1575400.1 phosphonate C-P lyase system protein PhnG [Alphaproteobacteria bacterium]MBU1830226.1 phosphonate C-P lyase system protein PhnG [Alphaproteobacteria bacterium]MBU2077977.1 phosphonate C-P lyase system protein PhnG [Alphaproteobacteria bacterium]
MNKMNPASSQDEASGPAARKAWMSVLAKSNPKDLNAGLAAFGALPTFDWLRRPEIGGVMVRGRMGGTGTAFNLGEMTATRCSLRLETGEVGHAYVQGRDTRHAEQAAIVDAMMQGPNAAAVQAAVLTPLSEALATQRLKRAEKAAATKVDFFTMVRGED